MGKKVVIPQVPEGIVFPDDATDDDIKEALNRDYGVYTSGASSPPNVIGQAYKDYVGGPLTSAATAAINPVISAGISDVPKAINKLAPSWFPGAPTREEAKDVSHKVAEFAVPQTLTGAGALAGLGAGGLVSRGLPWATGAGLRAFTGGTGGAAGAALEGEDPLAAGGYAALGSLIGEAAGAGGPMTIRQTVGRNIVSNSRLRNVIKQVEQAVPEYGPLIQSIKGEIPSPTAYSSRNAAALNQAAFGERGRQTLGAHLERGIRRAEGFHQTATGQTPILAGPGLQEAYNLMPDPVRRHLIGPTQNMGPGVDGFSLKQGQEILAWTGGRAFAQAPLSQGTDDVTQMIIWKNARDDIQNGLVPQAAEEYFKARNAYGIGESVHDMIRAGALQAEPNRILAAHRNIEMELNKNQAEYTRRMGPENFQLLWNAVAPGAAMGTGSRMPFGGGMPLTRLQEIARGTGSVTRVPMAAASVAVPSAGAAWTGRPPFRAQTGPQQAVLIDWPAVQAALGLGLTKRPEEQAPAQ